MSCSALTSSPPCTPTRAPPSSPPRSPSACVPFPVLLESAQLTMDRSCSQPGGVEKIHPVGPLAPSEQALLDACLPDLASNIAKVRSPPFVLWVWTKAADEGARAGSRLHPQPPRQGVSKRRFGFAFPKYRRERFSAVHRLGEGGEGLSTACEIRGWSSSVLPCSLWLCFSRFE